MELMLAVAFQGRAVIARKFTRRAGALETIHANSAGLLRNVPFLLNNLPNMPPRSTFLLSLSYLNYYYIMDKDTDLPPPLEDLTAEVEHRFGKDFTKVTPLQGGRCKASQAGSTQRNSQKARKAKAKRR